MDQLFDALLVMISGCTALYCYMLGRRLRALSNLRKGMGQAVVHMTQTMASVEANAQKLHRDTTTSVAELGAMLAKVDAYEEKIDLVLGTMDQQARQVWKTTRETVTTSLADVEETQKLLETRIADANKVAELMNNHIITLAELVDGRQKRMPKRQPKQRSAEASVDMDQAIAVGESRVALGGGTMRPWANVATAAVTTPEIIRDGTNPIVEIAKVKDGGKSSGTPVGYRSVNPYTKDKTSGGKK